MFIHTFCLYMGSMERVNTKKIMLRHVLQNVKYIVQCSVALVHYTWLPCHNNVIDTWN